LEGLDSANFPCRSATLLEMKPVFVSYSHEDQDVAQQLKQALAGHGFEAWLASDEIRPGQRVVDHIRDSLENASAVVILIGKQPSDWARYEWSQALELSWDEDRSVPLVPVLLHDAHPPSFLRDRRLLRFAGDPRDWEQVARTLEHAQTIERALPGDQGIALTERLVELKKTAAVLADEPLPSS
jgi:hypothetical protein